MDVRSLKSKTLFDFYKNIENGTEILSYEDLEAAISTMEMAKEALKKREQKRIRQAELDEIKSLDKSSSLCGKVLHLQEGLKAIDAFAFRNNKEIVKLVINEGLKQIGAYAFEGCSNLKEIVFPKNGILLRRGCFKDCTALKEIKIDDVSNIGPEAFINCTSLETLSLPATVSNVYSEAFKNCFSLKNVIFTKSKTNYYYGCVFSRAFENCTSLEAIELPPYLHFSETAFVNCSNLKTITARGRMHRYREFEKCDAMIKYVANVP